MKECPARSARYPDKINNKGLETLGGTTIPVPRPHFIVNPLSKHARFAPRIFCRAAGPELEGRMGPHTMGPARIAALGVTARFGR